jgi:hypothetical protein
MATGSSGARVLSPLAIDLGLAKLSLAAIGPVGRSSEERSEIERVQEFFRENLERMHASHEIPASVVPVQIVRDGLEETLANIEPANHTFRFPDPSLLEKLISLVDELLAAGDLSTSRRRDLLAALSDLEGNRSGTDPK